MAALHPVTNFFIFASGSGVTTGGVWAMYNTQFGRQLGMAAAVVGGAIAATATLGVAGACSHNKQILGVYVFIGLLCVAVQSFLVLFTTLGLNAEGGNFVTEFSDGLFRGSWEVMHQSNATHVHLQELQTSFKCCGYKDDYDLAVPPCPDNFEGGCKAQIIASINRFAGPISIACLILLGSQSSSVMIALRLLCLKKKEAKKEAISDDLTHPKDDEAEQELSQAALRVQSVFRAKLARIRISRKREWNTWLKLKKERKTALAFVHCVVLLFALFALYINLIFGVVFTKKEGTAWITACMMGMMMDLGVQQPVVITLKAALGKLLLCVILGLGGIAFITYTVMTQRNPLG